MSVIREEVKEYFEPFVNDLSEIYQDIELEGEVVWKGKRDCAGRWEVIKKHIKPGMVILDLGSSTGYFAIKIAKEFPTCLVISMECMPAEATLQRELLNFEELHNVVLLEHRLTVEDLLEWIKCVESIDLLLAVSVLHHFPTESSLDVLGHLSRMIPEIIAEIPEVEEVDACGQGAMRHLAPFKDVLEMHYPSVKSLGRFKSHLGEYERTVWKAKKIMSRGGLLAYWDSPNTIKRHTISKIAGEWKVDDKEKFIPGVNVWTLLRFNPIWPEPAWWQGESRVACKKAIESEKYISDLRPWNMLMTAKGLSFFDITDKFPKGDQAEFRITDPDKLERVFTLMKPVDWKTL